MTEIAVAPLPNSEVEITGEIGAKEFEMSWSCNFLKNKFK